MEILLALPGVVEAFFAIFGTLIGALFGFILSEWGTSRRENRNEKKQAQASRAIISLEIDLNLELLREFWLQPINQIQDKQKSLDEQKVALANNFIETPIPEWSREVFNSQLHLITNALHQQEVVKVFQFYDRLRRLEAIRNELILAKEVQRNELQAARNKDGSRNFGRYAIAMAYSPPTPFNEKAVAFWNECESLVAQLFVKGNPLKSQRLNPQ